jgi:hypothetical protein
MKVAKSEPDDRITLAHVVHRLTQQHGPRIVAHWLYHQARALTLEADRQAICKNQISFPFASRSK